MRKIDAHWEKRNFDQTVLEIEWGADDSIDTLATLEDDYTNYEYIVAKVPKGRMDLVHGLEDAGFRFMETQMELTLDLTKHAKTSSFTRETPGSFEFRIIDTSKDLEELLSNIDEGLFVTDRVSLDPTLGVGVAHQRYIHWIKDGYLSGNALILEVLSKSREIGFCFLTKHDDKTVSAELVSVYKRYRRRGVGLRFLEEARNWLAEAGYTKIITRVSSNNLEALRANLYVGFVMREIYYILRKITK